MDKAKVVVFLRNNARILINADPSKFKFFKNAVINPNLTKVRSVPPHFWKLTDGEIVPMTEREQLIRLKEISRNGVDNTIKSMSLRQFAPSRVDWYQVRLTLYAVVFGAVGLYGYLIRDDLTRLWENRHGMVGCLQKSSTGRRDAIVPAEINERVSSRGQKDDGIVPFRQPVSK